MNKPVAWMYIVNETWSNVSSVKPPDDAYDKGSLVPLYTYPAKENWKCSAPPCKCDSSNFKVCGYSSYTHPVKELTDEEIDELANKYLYVLNDVPYANDIKDFAKAILRKASEK